MLLAQVRWVVHSNRCRTVPFLVRGSVTNPVTTAVAVPSTRRERSADSETAAVAHGCTQTPLRRPHERDRQLAHQRLNGAVELQQVLREFVLMVLKEP